MKTKLLLGAICLLLVGCADKPTYEMSEVVRAKYPGCELVPLNDVVPRFYVRTKEGAVKMVTFKDDGTIWAETMIFNVAPKALTP